MVSPDDVRAALRREPGAAARDLLPILGVSQPVLSRQLARLGDEVVVLGRGRRTRYALRRSIRDLPPQPVYRVAADGQATRIATLTPTSPDGYALLPVDQLAWPVPEFPGDGLFEGLPYFIFDARPQGFLGRQFAQAHAALLHVPEDPVAWSDDDVFTVLALTGDDLPGDLIVGEASVRRFQATRVRPPRLLDDASLPDEYPRLAVATLAGEPPGSSAGGEFPKFTAARTIDGAPAHVIVKFSGTDDAPPVRRWRDLLHCEALAAATLRDELGIPAAPTSVHHYAQRTFLEVQRFDRIGRHGRAPACTLGSIDAALLGTADPRWDRAAAAMSDARLVDDATRSNIELLFHFGALIANTDMHGGNVAMRPRQGTLELAPAFDMLPMLYAPSRGGEVPERLYAPPLPLPEAVEAWRRAAGAALAFWRQCAEARDLSASFRGIAHENATELARVAALL